MTTTNPEATPAPAASAPLFNRNMTLVCLGQSLGYGASAFLAPLLPLYLVSQGHAEGFIGLVLAAFNVASFISRPLWGALCDRGYMRAGLTASGLLFGTAYAGYLVPGALFIFLVRGVHGIAWGGVNVVGSAWMAILAPANRRAEALGWYTMAQRLGTAVGPLSALWVMQNLGFSPAFMIGAAVAYLFSLSGVLTTSYSGRRTTAAPAGEKPSLIRSLIEPGALLGAALVVLMSCTGPAMNALMPLYFKHLGLPNIEWYYLVFGLTGLLCRPVIGLFADKIGRMRAITLGFGLQIAGLLVLGQSVEFAGIVVGMMVQIVGYAISEPSLYALAIDNTAAHRRGAAMATYTMAFQLGGGLGAWISGMMFEFIGYREAYQSLVLPVIVAFLVLLFIQRRPAAPKPAA